MKTVSLTRFFRPLAVFILTGIAAVMPAHATLLVYDGFTGYNAGQLAGQAPNANTVGLNTSVDYYDGPSARTANYTLTAGLSFGSLQTSGDALQFTSGTNVIGADISIGSTAFTGTLWSSYLIKFTSTPARGTASTDGATLRIGDTPADSNGGHFNSWADSRPTTASTNVSVGYSAGTLTNTNGTAPLLADTTYIIINSFTRVGQTLAVGANQGEARLWALTEAQFSAFLLAGGDATTLANLSGSSVTATASSSLTSGSFSFSSNDSISLVTVTTAGTYDELRFGSSLADVIPTAVPEPSSTAVIMGISCGLFFLGRRQSRRR